MKSRKEREGIEFRLHCGVQGLVWLNLKILKRVKRHEDFEVCSTQGRI